MSKTQPTLPLPNPEDWCSTAEAMELLDVRRSTLYRMLDDGVLAGYTIGSMRVWWRADVMEVADARRRLAGSRT